jgi:hypothetical protein
MANQFRAKPPKPPKPDPAAKEAKAKAEADAKAAAKKAQGPQPVVRVPSRGAGRQCHRPLDVNANICCKPQDRSMRSMSQSHPMSVLSVPGG